jgi:hypothetical protein
VTGQPLMALLAIPCCSGEPPPRRRRRTSAREQERNKPWPTGPHWTNQTHRYRAQNAPARAQQHGSELWSPVRDEEAAGSNPVTPTSEQVNVHDFPDKELGKAIPYGIYDVSANTGWVSVGTDHDTSAFAVATLRTWWETIGRARYPGASRLLICADGGGSNGSRVRAWKIELAAFAADTGLRVTVAHLPPGTSKWNKIEHRLFSQITLNWPGRPLTSHQVIVDLIANTSSATGLSVRAVLDTGQYPTGISYSDKDIAALPLVRHDFHGDWNYTLLPRDTP